MPTVALKTGFDAVRVTVPSASTRLVVEVPPRLFYAAKY
jgi:hypothetical protein